jgi:tetratricopeptide (TPR) repeat protein
MRSKHLREKRVYQGLNLSAQLSFRPVSPLASVTLGSRVGLILLAEFKECFDMGRLAARLFVVIFPSVFAMNVLAQTTASSSESVVARSETTPIARTAKELFGIIPISTRSEGARQFVELSLDKYENGLLDDAVVHARHATEKDPQFALGYAVLSFVSRGGIPDQEALAKAKSLLPAATSEEQLLVRWMTSVEDRDLLPAIMNINSLVKQYPNEKHVLFLAAEWLYFEQDYDRALRMMESVRKLDPNFAPVLKTLGFAYIASGEPEPAKAVATLERYAELQPSTPDPEASLGEVLRMVGDDQSSLEHYGAALQIDPTHFSSQVGLGDTLTLLGDFAGARREYDRAAQISENPRDELHARYQKALVYFWEGRSEEGRRALGTLAAEAVRQNEPHAKFEIGLGRAMLASDYRDELQQLHDLSALFQKSCKGMSESDRSAAQAVLLRERVRVTALKGLASDASDSVSQLEQFAITSRDQIVESAYESARGFLLVSQGDLANATDELATDPRSPLVLQQLAVTQEKLGNATAAGTTRKRLKYQRRANVEWYLVTHAEAAKR